MDANREPVSATPTPSINQAASRPPPGENGGASFLASAESLKVALRRKSQRHGLTRTSVAFACAVTATLPALIVRTAGANSRHGC